MAAIPATTTHTLIERLTSKIDLLIQSGDHSPAQMARIDTLLTNYHRMVAPVVQGDPSALRAAEALIARLLDHRSVIEVRRATARL